MRLGKPRIGGMVVAALCVAALVLPVSAGSVEWFDSALWVLGPVAAALVALSFRLESDPLAAGVSGLIGLAAAVWVALELIHQPGVAGQAALGYWAYVVGLGLLAWYVMAYLSASQTAQPWLKRALFLLVPGLFGLWLLVLWEVIVVGFGVPRVLLPAPSAVAEVFAASTPTLAADFVQTFVRAVIPGFLIGNGAGFVTALLADRVPFLRRGLLPLGNLVSAIPIVGIAPIMVMWFGFDWQSKAAVVVIMTFFPMLVNTITGLAESGAMERDLMHSYAAGYRRELLNLRLPNALPFVFNALKINSTLALIGAIVAEFFGTPIVGMGFRISTEVGRMNIDMVWATIAVAALSGSLFYGLFAVLERYLTFWHPSFRGRLR